MQSSYFRKNIEKMVGYVPGEQPQDGEYIKLNTNENPYPPSPKVLTALKEAVNEKLRLYPDPSATAVKEKVAEILGTRPERVMVGNGSDELLTIIIRCFVGKGDKVVYPYPTYLLYKILSDIQDGTVCTVDFHEDYSLPEEIVDKGGSIIFLCNPNSPSGTMTSVDEVSNIAAKTESVIVVDEAYVDFANDNCLRLVDEHPNLIILRTLSKSYSLAGMRLGFAIAQEGLISGMMKVKDSYNIDRLSIAAAVAALGDQETFRENVAKIRGTRERLMDALKKLGFSVYRSQTNFVMIKCANNFAAKDIYERLKEQKILIRYIEEPGLEDCLRITVGTEGEIDALLEKMGQIKHSS
ncbi:MAG: histidinol-phosphate transaminase [Candidatus Scalindua sp. AMX11]|nr:MAG: histidinol-phosphate transaminase [Candidatus Scalindua sp.]NOG82853.1 histidinol-phosphate transaminase [Planctomycetota bacterium]RZV86267.1 MAG: histidinol-phosphate transaminase [Candidatus Scalindua sp. SCAELEC01]TDE65818.1 MAG: histidinol-phosphate transaminase [Candidatus Scalindua sp. AMX11]